MKVLQFIVFVFITCLALTSHAAVNIQHWQTTSGARVYFVENHDLPIVDVAVTFAAGGAHTSQQKAGLAGVTHHMMDLGAGGMSEEAITNAFADIGARLGGFAGKDSASYSLRTLTDQQDKAFVVFNKILHQPDFPATVLSREKKRMVSGIRESKTKPESISNKAYMEALYKQHSYGLQATEETISALKVADLRQFYQTYYTAKSAVIALMGDMTKTQAEVIASSISQGLPQGTAIEKIAPVQPLEQASEKTIPHPASQAHIIMGQIGIKRGDPDYFPLYVGNYILGGGGFVSRLTEEVREKRGLVYSVYSYFSPMAEAGPFTIGLQTKKEQANEAIKVVNETVSSFINQGITQKELQAAKDNIIGGFPMRIDSNKKILGYLSMIGFYDLPLTYLEDFNQQVAKVTVQQVNDAFKRRIHIDKFATVIVGEE